METIDMKIPDRIKTLRKSLGLTQAEFSEKLKLAHSIISRIENGFVPLTDKNIALICMIFGVRDTWLRNGEGEMFDPIDNDPLINEVVKLMKKMDEHERIVVLNYVRWYVSQQQSLREAIPEPAPETPQAAPEPPQAAEILPYPEHESGEKRETPRTGPRLEDEPVG
jgi:transcriptional regulator with XRE-family HTH domain